MRRVLVTGAGFIGCYLVPQLLAAGDTVLVLGGRPGELYRELIGTAERCRHETADISDTGTVFDAVQSWRPDAIVHLASLLASLDRTELLESRDSMAAALFLQQWKHVPLWYCL